MQRWKLALISWLSAIIIAWGNNGGIAQINVQLVDVISAPNHTVSIPLLTSDLSGYDIISYQFEVLFDSLVIRAVGVSVEGTIAAPWGHPAVNLDSTGRMIVGNFGTQALSSGDTLLKLLFNVVGNPGDTSLIVLKEFQFNNGSPSAWLKNGRLKVEMPSGVARGHSPSVPRQMISLSNSPEPFPDRTAIHVRQLPAGPIEIDIFNILGQRVKHLGSLIPEHAQIELFWDATNQYGDPVPAGIYFCVVTQFNQILAVDRMICIK